MSNQSAACIIQLHGVITFCTEKSSNISVVEVISLDLNMKKLFVLCAVTFFLAVFRFDLTSPVHLLSVREAVESQCEAGVHPPEQAGH